MRRLPWRILALACVVLAAVLIAANVRLVWPVGAASHVAQLRFLDSAINGGAAADMQQVFPEGFVFTHGLRGLACVGVADAASDVGTRSSLLEQARASLAALGTDEVTAPFGDVADPPGGVFLWAWRARLRAGVVAISPAGTDRAAEASRLRDECDRIATAMERSPSPFLRSYPDQSWPVDSVVAAAALRAADRVLDEHRYAATLEAWVARAKKLADPASGLLPHRADPATGAAIDGPRGSSQSVINVFLPEIDPAWGEVQYRAFRSRYVDSVLGVCGVREYPLGVSGAGDIDSGPLVFGLSPSASVVTIGAARANGDIALANALSRGAEMGGLPWSWNGRKRYSLGILPVADAFVVWSRTVPVASDAATRWPALPRPWRFHGASAVAVGGLGWCAGCLVRRRGQSPSGKGTDEPETQ